MIDRMILGVLALAAISSSASAQQAEPKTDLYALELVESDLKEAKRLMTIYDRDDDGNIDKDEQQRLRWKEEVADFDLNRNGKLTHLELAVREAKRRGDDDITQFDVNNVNTFLNRYDRNRNGQLDPDEIESGGWPSEPADYDANGDGTLTAREMQRRFAFNRGLRREMGIEAVDQTGAMKWIRRFDKDNDKKLSIEESAEAPLPKPAKDYDEDNDGRLGAMELATMLAKHRRDAGLTKPDTHKIRRLFERYDFNGNGKIEPNETAGFFTQASGKQAAVNPVAQYDTNSDGVVTIREVEKLVAESRKEKGYVEVDFDKAVLMLRRHDENRSKHIEEYELFESPKAGQLPKSALKQADLDKDDRISLDELSRYFAAQRKKKEGK